MPCIGAKTRMHARSDMGEGLLAGGAFLQLAFLALPPIPHLNIADMGLVDVDRFELIAA
jgi:adenine deaminase